MGTRIQRLVGTRKPHSVEIAMRLAWLHIAFFILSPALLSAQQRQFRYHPEGSDFVIVNGSPRFNRALYGPNTAARVEAGDLPEFALYMPGMGGNLSFSLTRGTTTLPLKNARYIKASY